MGERKVINKYFPPDFNPAQIPRRKLKSKKQLKVRYMLSMSIRCNLCGNYMGKGTKINSRKDDDIGNKYLGCIQVFRFYVKCSVCSAEITLLTDPQNSDNVVESGGSRNFDPRRAQDEEEKAQKRKREAEELGDPMKSLENRTKDSKREIDKIVVLEELKSINSRHSKVSFDAMLNNLPRSACVENEEEVKLSKEEEALVKAKFQGSKEFVKRIEDEDEDEYESPGAKFLSGSLKKRKVSGGRLVIGSVTVNIGVVKKKPLNRQEEAEKTIIKDNGQGTGFRDCYIGYFLIFLEDLHSIEVNLLYQEENGWLEAKPSTQELQIKQLGMELDKVRHKLAGMNRRLISFQEKLINSLEEDLRS